MKRKYSVILAFWLTFAYLTLLLDRFIHCQPPIPSRTISLWIDPWDVHILTVKGTGKERIVSSIFDRIGQEWKFGRLIITVFANGRTLYPTNSSLFKQSRRYAFVEDPLRYILDMCSRKGIEVYACIDVLLWTRLGTPEQEDIFKEHPELMEKNIEGSCANVPEGKYASPWNEKVREELRNLVSELAQKYPGLRGIVLNCKLSSGQVLGYSEFARAAYIRSKQIDPIDIGYGGEEDTEEWQLYREWYQWKRDELGKVVSELGKIFLESNPNARVAVLGNANFYRWKLGIRGMSCADWASWAQGGLVNEVLLMDNWLDENNKGLFKGAVILIEKANINVQLTPVLQTREGVKKLEIEKQWENLAREGAKTLVLKVSQTEDIERAFEFLKKW